MILGERNYLLIEEDTPMTLSDTATAQLWESFRAGGGATLVREAMELVLQELIEAEAAEAIGAGRYERSETRVTERNGHRPRLLATRAGDVELKIPKLRKGSFFPSIIEPRRRIDRALWAVGSEAYVAGVSTRSVDDLVAALGAESGISRSEVSRICAGLDEVVEAFRGRRLDHVEFPYVYLDATYLNVRNNLAQPAMSPTDSCSHPRDLIRPHSHEQFGSRSTRRVPTPSTVEKLSTDQPRTRPALSLCAGCGNQQLPQVSYTFTPLTVNRVNEHDLATVKLGQHDPLWCIGDHVRWTDLRLRRWSLGVLAFGTTTRKAKTSSIVRELRGRLGGVRQIGRYRCCRRSSIRRVGIGIRSATSAVPLPDRGGVARANGGDQP